jgi:hypothetical protein
MTDTWCLLDEPSISPRLPAHHARIIVENPFTDRDGVHEVLFRFRLEAEHAVDSYGERTGRWYPSCEIGRQATFVEASDSPAACRRRADAARLAILAASLLESPYLTASELKIEVDALRLTHTGDLPARLKAFVARVDFPDYDPDSDAENW